MWTFQLLLQCVENSSSTCTCQLQYIYIYMYMCVENSSSTAIIMCVVVKNLLHYDNTLIIHSSYLAKTSTSGRESLSEEYQ